jgi:hypothetical protein
MFNYMYMSGGFLQRNVEFQSCGAKEILLPDFVDGPSGKTLKRFTITGDLLHGAITGTMHFTRI